MKYKLASWNVNGIRACAKKGFLDWLQEENSDIVFLQETKAMPEQLEGDLIAPKNYQSWFSSAEKKGYSGVALYAKKRKSPEAVVPALGIKKFDSEGRFIMAEYPHFFAIGGYFPNGQRDHGRVPYKLEFSEEVAKKALKLHKKTGKEVIICGDFNTAHHAIDLKNAKANEKTTGFLPEERKWMDQFIGKGFVDLFRTLHPEEEGHYTWWTYRSNCRERNIGWRIDYFFATSGVLPWVKNIEHRPDVMGSDHCPLVLELSIPT